MTPAAQRRCDGIGAVIDSVLPTETDRVGNKHVRLEPIGTQDEIAEKIRALAALGRTDRWQSAIRTWAHMVETADKPRDDGREPHSLRWAFLQYAVFAGHAAE